MWNAIVRRVGPIDSFLAGLPLGVGRLSVGLFDTPLASALVSLDLVGGNEQRPLDTHRNRAPTPGGRA